MKLWEVFHCQANSTGNRAFLCVRSPEPGRACETGGLRTPFVQPSWPRELPPSNFGAGCKWQGMNLQWRYIYIYGKSMGILCDKARFIGWHWNGHGAFFWENQDFSYTCGFSRSRSCELAGSARPFRLDRDKVLVAFGVDKRFRQIQKGLASPSGRWAQT